MPRSTATQRQVARDFGTCLNFDGTNAVVDIGATANIISALSTGDISISAWFKVIDNGAIQYVCGQVNTGSTTFLQLSVNTNSVGGYSKGRTLLQIRDQTGKILSAATTNASNYNDGQWHHLTVTAGLSTNTIAIYIDSVTQAVTYNTQATPSSFTSFGFNLQLGGRNLRGVIDGFFKGRLDDIRFYSTILSATAVSNLYYGMTDGSPISWYKFNEGSGTSATDSGSGSNTGTITGATYSTDVVMKPRTTAGQRQVVRDFGTCLSFPGNNNEALITTNASLNITDAITISAWINPTTFGDSSQGRIVDKDPASGAYGFNVENSAVVRGLRFFAGAGFVSNADILTLGVWQHVAVTYDKDAGSNQIKFYVNGVAAGTATKSSAMTTTIANFRIGSNFGGARDFNGLIDEVKLYSRALTATEILNEYIGVNLSITGLVLYTKFDEGSGTAVVDSSGTQANGTITGATYSTDVVMKPRTTVV